MKKNAFVFAVMSAMILFCIDIYSQTKELSITSHKPSGFLYENVNEITIIFSSDIVPINKGDELNPPVKIKPEIDGRWVWKSPRQLTFFPDDKLDQNRKYTVKIKKGLKSIDNKNELKKDFAFVFVNNANRVTNVTLYSNSRYSSTVKMKIEDTLSVSFVHPPLSADVDNKIFVMEKKTGKIVPIKIKFRKDPKTIDIIFKNLLSFNTEYTLKIDYTMRADAGDMGLASNYSLDIKTSKEILLLDHTKNEVNPKDPIKLKFTDYIESEDLNNRIIVIRGGDTLKSEEIEIWQDYGYEENSSSYNLYFYKDGESEYKIVLPKGYGKKQNMEYSFKVKSLPFDPYIDLNGQSFLLESYKSGMIPVKSMNYDSVKVEIFRIEEKETVKVISKFMQVSTKKNKYQTIPIKFKELVNGKSGFYRMTLTAKKKILFDCNVNFTRYALMAKLAYDKMIILAYDLETGEPVKGGEVSVQSKNLKGKTDKNGVCEFNCSLTKKERDGYGNLMIFFNKDGESSVLKVNDDSYGPDGNRNLYTSYGYYKVYNDDWSMKYYVESRTRMYVYTDRGLYKPGEVLYVKGIKRVIDKNEWGYSNTKKVNVTVSDSRNNEIKKLETSLNEYGTFAFACTLSASSPTGSYQIVSKSGDKEEYSYFRVEEFKPLEFDVAIVSNAKHVFSGDSPTASVSGRYMFGSQMSGDSIRWKITSQSYSFIPAGFEGYSFYSGKSGYYYDYGGYDGEYYDYDYSYGYRNTLYEGFGVLDSNGMYMISEKINPKETSSPVLLTYSATVKSASGQEITRSTNMVYHPEKTYVGIKSSKYVFDDANPPVLSIVSVDEAGKYVKGLECSLIVVCEKYVSVKKTGTYGRTFWESNYIQDTVILDNVKISGGNVDYKIKEKMQTGYYFVHAKYSVNGNNHLVSENFYYAGKDEGWWQVRDDNYIEVIPDKKSGEYEIGDRAKVLVKAPFKNLNGYVTIEREGIYEKFPIKMNSNAKTFEVPITEKMLPNSYFSVFLYKGRSSNEIQDDSIDLGKPYFGVGFCNLKVSSEKRKQKIEIKLDKESYRPQETVKASVQVLNSNKGGEKSEISVAVVDLGILNLIGFETPNPFKEFYKSRNHDVSLSTNAGDIVGERNYGEKGENRGGDGGMSKFRAEFLPIIYYKAQIETDKEGRAKIEFKLPDNLTTFRIMVVSCSKTDFGSGEKDFVVSKDFMINPSLLNFVRKGDEFIGGVVAVNMTKSAGEYKVECTADGALIAEDYNSKGGLAVNEKKEILYRFKIDSDKDTVVLKFNASFRNEEDNLLVKLPVRKNPLIHFAGIYESTEDEEKTHVLDLTSIPDATISASFSSSGMGDIKEAAKYLFDYPYGCLEQRTSKVFPLIIGEDIINAFDIGDIKQSKIKSIVQDYLNNLATYQQSNGGFSVWAHQGDPASSYLTNYVMYIMIYAKQNGYKVSDNVYEKAKEYVSQIAGGKDNSPYYDYYSKSALEATKTFAVYLMKMTGMNYESYIQQYAGRIEQMNGEALGWMLLLTQNSKNFSGIKERILQRISVLSQYEGMYAYFDCDESMFNEIYGSSVKTTALLFYAMLEEKGKSMNDPEKFIFWLLKRRTAGGYWPSTQENAFVILALEKYFRTFESVSPDFTASMSIDKKEIFEQIFKGYSLSQPELVLKTDGKSKKDINIKKEGKGRLFYKILVSYDSPSEQKQIDNGFEVTKTITPYKHDSLAFIRGMMYIVTLNIKTKSERMYVAVDDPVPAGFEIVNTDFVTSEFNGGDNEYNYESDYNGWFGNFNHKEKYFDRYLLFADYLPKGEYTQTYIIKAIYPGKYYMPPTKAEEMYTPINYGSSESRWVEIK